MIVIIKKLFSLDGLDRLAAIDELTIDERDEICESFRDCVMCPMALIYNSRPICAEVTFHYRIKRLLEKGGKFKVLEDIEK